MRTVMKWSTCKEEKKDIDIIEKENLVLGEKKKNLERDIERISNESIQINNNIARNNDKLAEIEDKIKVLANTIIISEISLNEKKAKVDDSIKVINEKKTEMIELGKKLKEITKTVTENKSEYQKNKINYENNLKQLEKLSDLNAVHIASIDKIEEEKNVLENKISELSELVKVSEKEFKTKEEEKNKLGEIISVNEKKISD